MSLHVQREVIAACEGSSTDGTEERAVSGVLAVVTSQLVGARELPPAPGPVTTVRLLARVRPHVSLQNNTGREFIEIWQPDNSCISTIIIIMIYSHQEMHIKPTNISISTADNKG